MAEVPEQPTLPERMRSMADDLEGPADLTKLAQQHVRGAELLRRAADALQTSWRPLQAASENLNSLAASMRDLLIGAGATDGNIDAMVAWLRAHHYWEDMGHTFHRGGEECSEWYVEAYLPVWDDEEDQLDNDLRLFPGATITEAVTKAYRAIRREHERIDR